LTRLTAVVWLGTFRSSTAKLTTGHHSQVRVDSEAAGSIAVRVIQELYGRVVNDVGADLGPRSTSATSAVEPGILHRGQPSGY
jgi:hypothetical protein